MAMVKDIAKLGVSDLRPPLTPSAYRDTILAQTKSPRCVRQCIFDPDDSMTACNTRCVFKSASFCARQFCHIHIFRYVMKR